MTTVPSSDLKPDEQQFQAITGRSDRPQKVIAGAGTGKTMTMAWRFAHLVTHEGVDANDIMAVTFTNKAAAELRDRIGGQLLAEGAIATLDVLDLAWIGTFHALVHRLLRENCYEAAFDRDLQLISPLEDGVLRAEILRDLRDGRISSAVLEPKELEPDRIMKLTAALLAPGGPIGTARSLGLSPDQMEEMALRRSNFWGSEAKPTDWTKDYDGAEDEALRIVAGTYREYVSRLARRKFIDYDGLLMAARDALEQSATLRSRVRTQFSYLIVDEFQDTNTIQFQLLKLLAADDLTNVAVVGDHRQAIYGWRDAKIRNLYDFPGEPLPLSINYRSNQIILDAANHVMERAEGTAGELPLTSKDRHYDPDSLQLFLAGTADEEATFVAEEIRRLLDDGVEPGSIAILSRARSLPVAFERELRRRRIPYASFGGQGFYEREEIKDIMAYLQIVNDPLADPVLIRLLQNGIIRVSDREMYRLFEVQESTLRPESTLWDRIQYPSIWEHALEPETHRRLDEALALVSDLAALRGAEPVTALIQRIIDRTGFADALALDPVESERRLGNLRKLGRLASEFESRNVLGGLGEFVEFVRLHADLDVPEAEADLATPDVVQLLTIHRAKGLEFDNVFLVQVKPFRSNDRNFVALDPEWGLLLKYADGDGESELPRFAAWRRLGETPGKVEKAELRRLMYVAVTRASRRLTVSATRKKEGTWEELWAAKEKPDDYFRELALFVRAGEHRGRLIDKGTARHASALPAVEKDAVVWEAPELPFKASTQDSRDERPTIDLSASHLEAFEQCALRYRYIYEWRLPAPPDALWPEVDRVSDESPVSIGGTLLGTLIHQLLERVHISGGTPDLTTFHLIWVHIASAHISEDQVEALWESTVKSFVSGYLQLAVSRYRTLATEQEFHLAFNHQQNEIHIQGFIDRIAEDSSGNRYLIDYKTTRDINQAARSAYGRQLNIYRKAAREVLDMEATPVLIDLRRGETIDVTSEGDAWDDVLRTVDEIISGRRVRSADAPCAVCAYRVMCPSSTARPAGEMPIGIAAIRQGSLINETGASE